MLMAVPKYGRSGTTRFLNTCRISQGKTIEGLSDRQRTELLEPPRRRAPGSSSSRGLRAREGDAHRADQPRFPDLEVAVSATTAAGARARSTGSSTGSSAPPSSIAASPAGPSSSTSSRNRYGTLRSRSTVSWPPAGRRWSSSSWPARRPSGGTSPRRRRSSSCPRRSPSSGGGSSSGRPAQGRDRRAPRHEPRRARGDVRVRPRHRQRRGRARGRAARRDDRRGDRGGSMAEVLLGVSGPDRGLQGDRPDAHPAARRARGHRRLDPGRAAAPRRPGDVRRALGAAGRPRPVRRRGSAGLRPPRPGPAGRPDARRPGLREHDRENGGRPGRRPPRLGLPGLRRPGGDRPGHEHPHVDPSRHGGQPGHLVGRGVEVVAPATGLLADGDIGAGRLADPSGSAAVEARLAGARSLALRRVLVGAGSTREPIDPVRYVGNRSSGRMGWAIAEAAQRRGQTSPSSRPTSTCRATRTSGTSMRPRRPTFGARPSTPSARRHPGHGRRRRADFAPTATREGKIDKGAKGRLALELEPTADILTELAARRDGQVVVGFAAEHGADGLARARGQARAQAPRPDRPQRHLARGRRLRRPRQRDHDHRARGGGGSRMSKDACAERILDAVVSSSPPA